MSDLDDALRRADLMIPTMVPEGVRVPAVDRQVLAAEVKRLRDLYGSLDRENQRLRAESVHAPVAMYGRPGREPICDFDCDYCREDSTLSEGHET